MGFKSIFILGWHFVLHMLRRLFFLYRPGGSDRFISNYRPDRILPIAEEYAKLLPIWQRCTGCGFCDMSCPVSGAKIDGHAFSIATLAMSGWRDFTALHHCIEIAAVMTDCDRCSACELACPEEIPVKKLARFVTENGTAIRDSALGADAGPAPVGK